MRCPSAAIVHGARLSLLLFGAVSCGRARGSPSSSTADRPARALEVHAFAVPGVAAPFSFDYLAVDRGAGRVYLPLPTGVLAVFDVAQQSFRLVSGFHRGQAEWRGRTHASGPTAASVGPGVVYVGNRGSSEVCVVDAAELSAGACTRLTAPPDGVAFVSATSEVWVTMPSAHAIVVLDARDRRSLRSAASIAVPGEPEGYAVDDVRGVFFTNLEDEGATLAIDVKTRKVRARWNPECGAEGPRGLAFDSARQLLFVACTDHVQVLDAGRGGARLGRLETGEGVDNLDYLEPGRLLFAAAGKAALLTVARVGDDGTFRLVTRTTTAKGARNSVADAQGRAYVPAPSAGALLVVSR